MKAQPLTARLEREAKTLKGATAKALLAAGEKTEAVSASVGFDSYRGLVKAFTRLTGAGPGAHARRPGRTIQSGAV